MILTFSYLHLKQGHWIQRNQCQIPVDIFKLGTTFPKSSLKTSGTAASSDITCSDAVAS